MPRPPINDEFVAFHKWLIEQGYNPSSANTYTSAIRLVHRELGNSIEDQEAVEDFFARKAQTSPTSLPRLLTSYKRARDWYLECQGVVIPLPRKGSLQNKPRTKAIGELHPEVRKAIRSLREHAVPLTAFNSLCWYHVNLKQLNQVLVHIEIPSRDNEYWRVPGEAIRTLWKHFNPNGNLGAPLVPKEHGSTLPYPYHALKAEVMRYSPEEVEAMIAPPGSALAGYSKPSMEASEDASERSSPERRVLDPYDTEEDVDEPKRTTKELLSDLLSYDPNSDD